MHFERMADDYAHARPPYPPVLYDALEAAGVVGPGRRLLEVGAGAGLATAELVRRGCDVTSIEPGERLSGLLRERLPGVEVVTATLEDADLAPGSFDAVVAATALHWVDLEVGLPAIHATLRDGGRLGVWRTIFGDDDHPTAFRARVAEIARRRGGEAVPREHRPTVAELTAGGLFVHERTDLWPWSIDLEATQVRHLFASFSDWTPDEVEQAGRAADDLGGRVTEHYRTVLHLLRRAP